MTICMAALCQGGEDGPVVVIAADRMVTVGGFIEFEHTVPKMAYPSATSVVLIAGDTLIGTRLANGLAEQFGETPTVADIAARLSADYVQLRQAEIENQTLKTRGLTLAGYYGAQGALNPQLLMVIDQAMTQLNLGIELLVAGVDASGAHIYSVLHPGTPTREHDVIGYSAIGSGAIHAIQAMIGFRHSASADLPETVFRVYAAKRRAEVAPGVGLDTDVMIITKHRRGFLDGATIGQLSELYDNYGKAAEEAQVHELEKLDLHEPGMGVENGTEATE